MRHYVTACKGAQLRVLWRSMDRHCHPFTLHVLAWDWTTDAHLENVRLTPRGRFLERHPDLAPDLLHGQPRTPIEQVCTARWTFICDVMEDVGEPVTLVDGDMMFWSSPEPLFQELQFVDDVAVSPHGFAPAAAGLPGATVETHRQYGLYNGGWVYFAHPRPALYMARQTKAWSYSGFLDHPGGRRTYGDQGFLELVQELFGGHVISHPGVNVGPWNIHRRVLDVDPFGDVLVDGRPLVSYHYSSFRRGAGSRTYADPAYELTATQQRILYWRYEQEVDGP